MTKKDYVRFAAMLRRTRERFNSLNELEAAGVTSTTVLWEVESEMWEIFTEDNGLFDSGKFAKASGRYDA